MISFQFDATASLPPPPFAARAESHWTQRLSCFLGIIDNDNATSFLFDLPELARVACTDFGLLLHVVEEHGPSVLGQFRHRGERDVLLLLVQNEVRLWKK